MFIHYSFVFQYLIPDCSIRVALVNLTALIECLTVLLEYINLLCVTLLVLHYSTGIITAAL